MPQLQNAKNMTHPWIHMFLYGETGSGKTLQAASFPNPVFIIPKNEQSIVTLRGRDIPYYEVGSMRDMLETIDIFERIQSDPKRGPNDLPGETLVIESLSHYLDMVLDEIVTNTKAKDLRQAYGQIAAHFRNVQNRLRRISMHSIYTSLAGTEKNDDGDVVAGSPLISGKTKDLLPSACDIVAFAQYKEGKPPIYRIHTQKFHGYVARSRFEGMPAEFVVGRNPEQSLWTQMKPYLVTNDVKEAPANGANATPS